MKVEMNHDKVKVIRRTQECRDTFTLELDSDVQAGPGHFFMLYLPDLPKKHPETGKKQGQERPFTVAGIKPLRFTMRKAGPFTDMASTLGRKDHIQVTGPLGNSYLDLIDNKTPNHYLIAGGCGAAGHGFLAEELFDLGIEPSFLVGAKSKEDLLVPGGINSCVFKAIYRATEDGTDPSCIMGNAVDLIDKAGPEEDAIAYVCGPRPMLVAAADKLLKYGIDPENILLALEPIMKCGRGVCGSCEIDGYHACTDGPIFRYSALAEAEDFKEYTRAKSGKLLPI